MEKGYEVVPERVVTIPEKFQAIKTDASKYCDSGVKISSCGESTIADGPVIIAEEVEKFSTFPAQLSSRSRIVLVSDATLIQNDCLGRTEEQDEFIRSLYPEDLDNNSFAIDNYQNLDGRNFEHTQKIKAPELGSPYRFYAASGLQGLGVLFDGVSVRPSSQTFDEPINPSVASIVRPTPPEKEGDRKRKK